MASDGSEEQGAEELAGDHREKEAQVLEREGVEEHLMQQDESEAGEEISGVEEGE